MGELVSVLIRTTGRATLARAVRSVLSQTCPDVGVKVVLAGGRPLSPMPAELADPRVQVIDPGHRLDRAAAANAALAATESALALFLDDDDWLLPDHIERLRQELEAHPEAVAAHAGVECVSGGGDDAKLIQVFDRAVQWPDMQLQNHLPIHAVLFRMSVVHQAPALRFEESLAQFEDWDFWLQLIARGPLVRVPGVSAVYQLNAGDGSGHAVPESDLRQAMLAQFAARQLERWEPQDVVWIIEENARVRAALNQAVQEREVQQAESLQQAAQLGLALQQAREQALQLGADVQQLQHRLLDAQALQARQAGELQALRAELTAVYGSQSWRITAPLRAGRAAGIGLAESRPVVFVQRLRSALSGQVRRHGWRGLLRRMPAHLSQWRRHARTLSSAPSADARIFSGRAVAAPWRPHPEIDGVAECLVGGVSVVIPTFNAGAEFASLLTKLKQQQGVDRVELVIVDSGSTDGTVETAKAMGARLVQISQAEFSHSHARNLGADKATGEHLVFMVQDAYPIGRLWLYAMLRWLQDHRAEGVVAASCSEYCRSDSDVMYDSMVQTHYRFLGCLEADRIGEFKGQDHMALRSMGQLSDVACMLPRALFLQYRYRGDYAEDLDLGIRLIKDGHRVAMLASVKVIHSHNRPAYYYLKRSFVDVIFLVGLFDDFHVPPCQSASGLVAGAARCAALVAAWLRRFNDPLADGGLDELAPRKFSATPLEQARALGDARLDQFIERIVPFASSDARSAPALHEAEAQQFVDSFMARIDHLHQYLVPIYTECDARIRQEVSDAVRKVFGSTLGAALAFLYLDRRDGDVAMGERQWIDAIFVDMKAGV